MATPKISNNQSWENIFNRYKILNQVKSNGYADITANEIKDVDGKEARLMTKVDFRQNLPTIMSNENLSILAIKNGLYRIAKNDPFINIQKKIHTKIIDITAPKDIVSIDLFNIKSEGSALDIAYITMMCDRVFKEESNLTIRGRLRGDLSFKIGTTPYDINGVQIEVDGGYEAKKAIHLIEAKIGFRDNINIRQLLYPQLYWEKKVKKAKDIKSYIFYLQDDVFRFIPYIYDGVKGYADHTQETAFRFIEPTSTFSIYDISIDEKKIDRSVPFPQADKLDKINDMMIVIFNNESLVKYELELEFDIVPRQIDYYFNVLKWLKVCTEKDGCLILTKIGEKIIALPFKRRIEELAKIVFAEPIFHKSLHDQFINEELYLKYKMQSPSTRKRRLQTVIAWIKYFKTVFEG
ncbi:MAG: hypothetical protein KAH18_08880 [Psychromonas sp.]|nr:hypothetical protein [Psychromonas sp.]